MLLISIVSYSIPHCCVLAVGCLLGYFSRGMGIFFCSKNMKIDSLFHRCFDYYFLFHTIPLPLPLPFALCLRASAFALCAFFGLLIFFAPWHDTKYLNGSRLQLIGPIRGRTTAIRDSFFVFSSQPLSCRFVHRQGNNDSLLELANKLRGGSTCLGRGRIDGKGRRIIS